jgi:hypothetical protein
MVCYDTEFEGWPTKGSTAAPSHPSEGWHEKGHTSGQNPDVLSVVGLLEPCSSLARFMVWDFFFKKGNEPSGSVKQPRELLEPTAKNFLSRSLAYLRRIPANGNRGFP